MVRTRGQERVRKAKVEQGIVQQARNETLQNGVGVDGGRVGEDGTAGTGVRERSGIDTAAVLEAGTSAARMAPSRPPRRQTTGLKRPYKRDANARRDSGPDEEGVREDVEPEDENVGDVDDEDATSDVNQPSEYSDDDVNAPTFEENLDVSGEPVRERTGRERGQERGRERERRGTSDTGDSHRRLASLSCDRQPLHNDSLLGLLENSDGISSKTRPARMSPNTESPERQELTESIQISASARSSLRVYQEHSTMGDLPSSPLIESQDKNYSLGDDDEVLEAGSRTDEIRKALIPIIIAVVIVIIGTLYTSGGDVTTQSYVMAENDVTRESDVTAESDVTPEKDVTGKGDFITESDVTVEGDVTGRDVMAERERRLTRFASVMSDLKAGMPSQSARSWATITAPVKRLMIENHSKYPAVILLTSPTTGTASCIAHNISQEVTSIYKASGPLVMDAGQWSDLTGAENKQRLEEEVRGAVEAGSKVILLLSLELLHPQAAIILHALCDTSAAPYKHVIYLFTLHIPLTQTEAGLNQTVVEDYLTGLWEGDVTKDSVPALLSRIANNVVFLRDEKEDTLQAHCPPSTE